MFHAALPDRIPPLSPPPKGGDNSPPSLKSVLETLGRWWWRWGGFRVRTMSSLKPSCIELELGLGYDNKIWWLVWKSSNESLQFKTLFSPSKGHLAFHQSLSLIKRSSQSKVIVNQRLSFIKGHLPSKVVILPSNIVSHQMSSSIKVVFHPKLFPIKGRL